jgi:hypothetical protein
MPLVADVHPTQSLAVLELYRPREASRIGRAPKRDRLAQLLRGAWHSADGRDLRGRIAVLLEWVCSAAQPERPKLRPRRSIGTNSVDLDLRAFGLRLLLDR